MAKSGKNQARKGSEKRKGFIGVFDSGFGGLEILREIIKVNPKYDYVYFGDTARVPYGNRTKETVYNFTEEAVDFLFKRGARLIILACNTASSEALRKIQRGYLKKNYPERRVLGVIVPVAEEVANRENKRIGIIGTKRTINSGAFVREIKKRNKKAIIFQNPCPLLVPLIENNIKGEMLELAIRSCLSPLLKKRIDSLILACTHYGLIKNKIRRITGEKIKIISEGKIVAKKLKDYLLRHPEIETNLKKGGRVEFLTTDLSDDFQNIGSKFFGRKVRAKKVN